MFLFNFGEYYEYKSVFKQEAKSFFVHSLLRNAYIPILLRVWNTHLTKMNLKRWRSTRYYHMLDAEGDLRLICHMPYLLEDYPGGQM